MILRSLIFFHFSANLVQDKLIVILTAFIFISFSLFGEDGSKNNEVIIKNEKGPPTKFKSELIGNIPAEYYKNIQLTPIHSKTLRENQDLWFADKFRAGFALRPRIDSTSNFDFDKSTADDVLTGSNQTQFYLFGHLNPNVLFKVTLQDLRLWGGEVISNSNQDQKYADIANGGNTYDTTKQRLVAVNNYSGIREAFVDFKTSNNYFKVRIGRQNIDFGDGRIIGGRIDTQQGNSFDGLRFTTKIDSHTADFFGTLVSSENSSNGLVSNGATKLGGIGDAYFGGANYNLKLFDWFGIDLYNFMLYKKRVLAKSPPDYASETKYRGDDQLNTSGFRLTNRTQGNNLPTGMKWDWMIEAAWQSGFNGNRVAPDWLNQNGQYVTDINTGSPPPLSQNVKYRSHLIAVQTGYSPVKEFRIGLQYTYASGDPNRNDSSVGTFNPLFASRRMASGVNPFQGNGNSGMVFWQNVKDYSLYLKYDSDVYGTFIFNPHLYEKVKLQDGYYDNNNYVLGYAKTGGVASTEDYYNNQQYQLNKPSLGKRIASEYNFIYIVTPFDNVSFWLSYSYVHAGDAVKNQKNNVWNSDPAHRYDFKPDAHYLSFQTVFAI
jgi:hypothetical protein